MEINVVPTLVGSGERLFDGVGDDLHGLEFVRTVAAPRGRTSSSQGAERAGVVANGVSLNNRMQRTGGCAATRSHPLPGFKPVTN